METRTKATIASGHGHQETWLRAGQRVPAGSGPGSWRFLSVVTVVSACAIALTRFATLGHSLWAWDSVNFALAITRIDLSQHQPHPPGYFGYVVLARLLRFGASENVALLRVGLLGSTLTAVLTWRFSERLHGSRSAAWVAWALIVFSPLHWFYGSVAEIYAVEVAVTLAIAYAAYGMCNGDRVAPAAMACSVFAGLLLKSPAVVLMVPLVVYAFIQADGPTRRRIVAALAGALLCAAAFMGSIAPLRTIAGSFVEESSLLANLNLRVFNRTVRDMAYAAVAALGVGVGAVLALGRPRTARLGPFLAIWICGYVLTCLFVHFPKPGYLLPLLPVMSLVACAPAARLSKRGVLATIAIVACANTAQFALVPPFSPAATGEGLRYADKSLAQQLKTEANSVLRPSTHAIREFDGALAHLLQTVAAQCPAPRQLVLVQGGGIVSWRHAMFYLPDATVVELSAPGTPMLVARDRTWRIQASDETVIEGDCVTVVEDKTEAAFPGRDAFSWERSTFGAETVATFRGPVAFRVKDNLLSKVAR